MKIALGACAALSARRGDPDPPQDYPKGPVTLVIPLAPGDANRYLPARAIAEECPAAQGGDRPGEPARRGGALGTASS